MKKFSIDMIPVGLCLLILTILPLVWIAPPLQWHDQQRIGQIVLGACALCLLWLQRAQAPTLGSGYTRVLALVIGAGVISSLLAHQPAWAFAEMALFAVCLTIVLAVVAVRQAWLSWFDRVVLLVLLFIGASLLARFLVAYSAALTVPDLGFYPWVMVSGFSNVRFQGQFMTMVAPLALLPCVSRSRSGLVWAGAALAVGIWMMVIAVGTRGTWLGLGTAALILFWFGGTGRRLAVWIVASSLAGWATVYVLFDLIPSAVSGASQMTVTHKELATLSERDIIWGLALKMIAEKPWLGVGPMHFADAYNLVAAHPHQAWLQWASEWGVPSALMLSWVFLRAAIKTSSVLKATAASPAAPDQLRFCLAASVLASLTQAMVDGVFVMPYSQLWLSILLGWLWALHPVTGQSGSRRYLWPWLAGALVAQLWLGYVVVRDYPTISNAAFRYGDLRDLGMPRFWLFGMIYRGGA